MPSIKVIRRLAAPVALLTLTAFFGPVQGALAYTVAPSNFDYNAWLVADKGGNRENLTNYWGAMLGEKWVAPGVDWQSKAGGWQVLLQREPITKSLICFWAQELVLPRFIICFIRPFGMGNSRNGFCYWIKGQGIAYA